MEFASLFDWRVKPSQSKIELRDKILTVSSLGGEIWGDIFALHVLCSFSGLEDVAKRVLEAYFDAEPSFEPRPWSPAKRILGLIWKHAESTKPGNIPWDVDGFNGALNPPEYDIGNPAFFQLDNWTDTSWIPSLLVNSQRIDGGCGPHDWRTSEDAWMHAICARLLCRVPEGQVADQAAISEAFEAVNRLFEQLPRRRGESHHFMFPMKIYFCLAVGLGKREKAKEIFQLACTAEEWCPEDLLLIPALYTLYFGDEAPVSKPRTGQLIAESDATPAVKALAQRKQNGRQEPLHGVAWPELLQRFSRAAFKVYRDDYAKIDDPPQRPSDILLPPITPDKLVEVEQQFGPLPADLREMVQIANGFRGTWHFLGGGFPGVHKLMARPSRDYEIFLDVKPEPTISARKETKPDGIEEAVMMRSYEIRTYSTEGMNTGSVWVGYGAVENDGFEHVICPPDTWRKLAGRGRGAQGGGDVERIGDSGYRVTCFAHWGGGGAGVYRSMRHWIASVTAGMERQLELEDEKGEDGGDEEEREEE